MPAIAISSVGIGFLPLLCPMFRYRTYFVIHPLRFPSQRAQGFAESAYPQDGGDDCPCADKNANPYDARGAIDNLPDSVVIDVQQDDTEQQTRQRVLGKEPHWLPLLSWDRGALQNRPPRGNLTPHTSQSQSV